MGGGGGISAPLPCFIPLLIASRCMSDDVFNKMLIKSASLQASADCSSAATLPDINVHALSYFTLTLHAQIISSFRGGYQVHPHDGTMHAFSAVSSVI